MKSFDDFRKLLSEGELAKVFKKTELQIANDATPGTFEHSLAFNATLTINLIELYHEWLQSQQ